MVARGSSKLRRNLWKFKTWQSGESGQRPGSRWNTWWNSEVGQMGQIGQMKTTWTRRYKIEEQHARLDWWSLPKAVVLVVHQELHQIEQISGPWDSEVANAAISKVELAVLRKIFLYCGVAFWGSNSKPVPSEMHLVTWTQLDKELFNQEPLLLFMTTRSPCHEWNHRIS